MPWASQRYAFALVSCFLQCNCVRQLCGAVSRATSAHALRAYCCPTLSLWLKPSPQAPGAAHPAASLRSASQPRRARPGSSKHRVCRRRQGCGSTRECACALHSGGVVLTMASATNACLARSGKALGRHPLRAHTARGLTMRHCTS
ncbi:hypothetical protein K438DRAFT_1821128 [Mycena galopus ATCC 62051]|nr:hypothetical protein K438DRAFT_1821128 [Mycena galopus ATCC 62051]